MRNPQSKSLILLLIFLFNISVFPLSLFIPDSDLENQNDTPDAVQAPDHDLRSNQGQNSRYEYDVAAATSNQGGFSKALSSWSPPSVSGTTTALNVTEYADTTKADQQIQLIYTNVSGTPSYSSGNAFLDVPPGWNGTRMYTFVDNLHEDRVWINNTGLDGVTSPPWSWSIGFNDTGASTNTIISEWPNATFGGAHFWINGSESGGKYYYDANDRGYFRQTVTINRGPVVSGYVEMNYWEDNGKLTGGPHGDAEIYVAVNDNGIPRVVWNLPFKYMTLKKTWLTVDPSLTSMTDLTPFNTPGTFEIEVGLRYPTTKFENLNDYFEAYMDNATIHLVTEAKPSDLGLTMNGYNVTDGIVTTPDNYTRINGTISSGDVTNLQSSDNSYLIVNSVLDGSSNKIDLYTYYNLSTDGIPKDNNITILELWIEAAYTSSITDGDLLVYNVNTVAWEKIHDGYTPNRQVLGVGKDEAWSWITTEPLNYINGSNVIKFRINGTSSSPFSLEIDYVHFAMTTAITNAAYGVGMYVQDRATPWNEFAQPVATFTFNYTLGGWLEPELNVTVTFDCDQRFYASREAPDSLYELAATSSGINYSVDNGTAVTWDFYVYISVPSGYKAPKFTVSVPSDWSTTWVSEPQTPTVNNTDKTYLSTGVLTVPLAPITTLPDGFWHIIMSSPNYGQSLEIQIEDPPGSWRSEIKFYPTNTTQANGTLLASNPNSVNITWYTPDGTEFTETHYPANYTRTNGTLSSGTVAYVQSSDDLDLVIDSVLDGGSNKVDLYFNYSLDTDGIVETDVTNLELWIEAAYNTSIDDGDLFVYNFDGSTWEKINDTYKPTTDLSWRWTTANPSPYIDNTSREIWFRVNGTHSSAPISIGIDYVHFRFTFLNYIGLSGDVYGIVTTPNFTLPAGKTMAGQWTVIINWFNGTEMAYLAKTFDLYHPSILQIPPQKSQITARVGDLVTVQIIFLDNDTLQRLSAGTVQGFWNGNPPPVDFIYNSQFNWWEGYFNASALGTYNVEVTASAPYYNDPPTNATVQIVIIKALTTLTIQQGASVQTLLVRWMLGRTALTTTTVIPKNN